MPDDQGKSVTRPSPVTNYKCEGSRSVRGLGSITDAELVLRLPGDAAAFEELFRRHRRSLVAYATRRCPQPADVADLVAATFLAVLTSSATYSPEKGAFRPWLIGVAYRQSLALRRGEYRQWSLTRAVSSQRILGDDAIARIEERIDAARASAEVERALNGLPSGHREVLWLVGYDGLTPHEAAQVLGVNVGLFRVRLSRARQALRQALRDPLPPSCPNLSPEVPR
jgi:RNA polymerase sigma factor (sigma-70 family)